MRQVWCRTNQKMYKSMADIARELATKHQIDINFVNPTGSWVYIAIKRMVNESHKAPKTVLGNVYVGINDKKKADGTTND